MPNIGAAEEAAGKHYCEEGHPDGPMVFKVFEGRWNFATLPGGQLVLTGEMVSPVGVNIPTFSVTCDWCDKVVYAEDCYGQPFEED